MRGFWCGPFLPVGQLNGKNEWHLWRSFRLTSWVGVNSWFPYDKVHRLHTLNLLWDGFLSKWHDPLWKEPIKYAINWYIEANLNAGALEGAIVLTQTALELFGWLYLVEDQATRSVSKTQFDKSHAHQKIRSLLTAIRIPCAVPAEMPNLLQEAQNLCSAMPDGPCVFAELRNSIVHPKERHRAVVAGTSRDARVEAWSLGLWYVELAFLGIFGYQGEYYRRFVADLNNAIAVYP
jgi:hypothetical protein